MTYLNLYPKPPVIHYWPFQGGSLLWLSVTVFGARVLLRFHIVLILFLVRFRMLSVHLSGNSYSLG